MEGTSFIKSICIKNFLSFGGKGEEIVLEPLNVIIGPNASGKSNLIEIIGMLRSLPKDLSGSVRESGGIREWLWKGDNSIPTATVETTINYPAGIKPLRHSFSVTMAGQRLEVVDEVIENENKQKPTDKDVYFFYRYNKGNPVLNVRTKIEEQAGTAKGRQLRNLRREDISPEQSVLSQRKDPDQYPEVTYLAEQLGNIMLYREWNFGRYTAPRMPQKTDLPEDFLLENAANLGLVLNNLLNNPKMKREFIEKLHLFYDAVDDISTRIQGGTVQVFIHEKGVHEPIPATRLSDGTLRYMCLLSILCHPAPPPVICIEEPELGLHPDILPTIADLLKEASKRTQLIVTTHSDALVSALSDTPEAVLVCERNESGTTLRRLDGAGLQSWLNDYSLGELWRMGEIGGNRW